MGDQMQVILKMVECIKYMRKISIFTIFAHENPVSVHASSWLWSFACAIIGSAHATMVTACRN